MKQHKKGFTLVELLVVVLIVGVLAAIALPMYQKAVMKSRFSALMPIGKAMADSNEAYYLEHNAYASNPQDLLVQGQEEYPTGTEVELAPGLEYAYVLVSNDLARNNYIVYQKHSGKFADNIHCEALEEDAQANEICTSLGGEYIPGSLTDGYKTYVLSGNPGTDKLPTSYAKLSRQLCTSVGQENCNVTENSTTGCTGDATTNTKTCTTLTYDEETGEVNYEKKSTTCGNISYKKKGFSDNFSGTGCVNTIYDEDGNQTGYYAKVCHNGLEGEQCKANGTTFSMWEYDESGNALIYASCQSSSATSCLKIQVENYAAHTGRYCQGINVKDDGSCAQYSSNANGQWGWDNTNNQNNQTIANRYCSALNQTTGACTGYANAMYYGYDGDSQTTRTQAYRNGTQAIIDYTDYVDDTNSYSSRTCYDFDWETGVCNRWTAN